MISDNINKKFFEGKLDLIEFTNRISMQSLDEIKNEDNENFQLKICQSNDL